jgi:hypothetical protein
LNLSPLNSTIGGWYFVEDEWLISDVYRSLLTWEMDMMENRLDIWNDAEEDPLYILMNIVKDMA